MRRNSGLAPCLPVPLSPCLSQRVGSSNRQAQDEEVRRLYIEGSGGGFEALPCRGVTLADLSEG
jgi:hypothetical protein